MRQSAGILAFRRINTFLEFFLVHPGGPFWKNKETGAWSIPKGEFMEPELPLQAAQREFFEETGQKLEGNFIPLDPIRQKSGKLVFAWAIEKDIDAATIVSNSFQVEWPYRSGKWKTYPEVDKAGWFSYNKAMDLINPAQVSLLDQLVHKLG